MSLGAPADLASIPTRVQDCLSSFHDACTSLPKAEPRIRAKISPGTLHDCLGRFRLWVGNIGAHRRGKGSLDYKLREASHIRDRVTELLDNLKDVLREALEIIKEDRVPWEDLSDSDSDDSEHESQATDDEPTTELTQLVSNMAEINSCLMRLSLAIRNPAPHDQFKESAQIDVTHYEVFDVDHVRGKFPKAEEYLVFRLGKAISRRRQYLRYREEHRKKLEQGLKPQPILQELAATQQVPRTVTAPSEKIESTVASSLPPAIKASHSSANLVDEDYYEDTLSQTSYASSNNDPSRSRPPPLPEEGQDGNPFECPLCFRFTSVRQITAWHKHVYRDLQPYVCTFDECEIPDRTYESRHEWFQHELQAHRKWWECIDGCNKTFQEPDGFRRHLSNEHTELSDDARTGDLMRNCERSVPMDTKAECHLCQQELPSLIQLRRHLGKHHEELALFALPSHMKDDDDKINESDNVNCSQSSVAGSDRSMMPAAHLACESCDMEFRGTHAERLKAFDEHSLSAHNVTSKFFFFDNEDPRLAEASKLLIREPSVVHTMDSRVFDVNAFDVRYFRDLAPKVKTWAGVKEFMAQGMKGVAKDVQFARLELLQAVQIHETVTPGEFEDYFRSLIKFHSDRGIEDLKNMEFRVGEISATLYQILEVFHAMGYLHQSNDTTIKWPYIGFVLGVRHGVNESVIVALKDIYKRYKVPFDEYITQTLLLPGIVHLQVNSATLPVPGPGRLELSHLGWKYMTDTLEPIFGVRYSDVAHFGAVRNKQIILEGKISGYEALDLVVRDTKLHFTFVDESDFVPVLKHTSKTIPDKLRLLHMSPAEALILQQSLVRGDAADLAEGVQATNGFIYHVTVESSRPMGSLQAILRGSMISNPSGIIFSCEGESASKDWTVPKEHIIRCMRTHESVEVVVGKVEMLSSFFAGPLTLVLKPEDPDDVLRIKDLVEIYIKTNVHDSSKVPINDQDPREQIEKIREGHDDDGQSKSNDAALPENDSSLTNLEPPVGNSPSDFKIRIIGQSVSDGIISFTRNELIIRSDSDPDACDFIWSGRYPAMKVYGFDLDNVMTLHGLRHVAKNSLENVKFTAVDPSQFEGLLDRVREHFDTRRAQEDTQLTGEQSAEPELQRSLHQSGSHPDSDLNPDQESQANEDDGESIPQHCYLDTYPPSTKYNARHSWPVELLDNGWMLASPADLEVHLTHIALVTGGQKWYVYYKNITNFYILGGIRIWAVVGELPSSIGDSAFTLSRKNLVIEPIDQNETEEIGGCIEMYIRQYDEQHASWKSRDDLDTESVKQRDLESPHEDAINDSLPKVEDKSTRILEELHRLGSRSPPHLDENSNPMVQRFLNELPAAVETAADEQSVGEMSELPPLAHDTEDSKVPRTWGGSYGIQLDGVGAANLWNPETTTHTKNAPHDVSSLALKTEHPEMWATEPCDLCVTVKNPIWYCIYCGVNFCNACWDKQEPHKPGREKSDGIAHEKVDLTGTYKDEFAFTVERSYDLGAREQQYVSFRSYAIVFRHPGPSPRLWNVLVESIANLRLSGRTISVVTLIGRQLTLTAANINEAATAFEILEGYHKKFLTSQQKQQQPDTEGKEQANDFARDSSITSQSGALLQGEQSTDIALPEIHQSRPSKKVIGADVVGLSNAILYGARIFFVGSALRIDDVHSTPLISWNFYASDIKRWMVHGEEIHFYVFIENDDEDDNSSRSKKRSNKIKRLSIKPRNFDIDWFVDRLESWEAGETTSKHRESKRRYSASDVGGTRLTKDSEAEQAEPQSADEPEDTHGLVPQQTKPDKHTFDVRWAEVSSPDNSEYAATEESGTLTLHPRGVRLRSESQTVELEYIHMTSLSVFDWTVFEVIHGGTTIRIQTNNHGDTRAATAEINRFRERLKRDTHDTPGTDTQIPDLSDTGFVDDETLPMEGAEIQQSKQHRDDARRDEDTPHSEDDTTYEYHITAISTSAISDLFTRDTKLSLEARKLRFTYIYSKCEMAYNLIENVRVDGSGVQVIGIVNTDADEPGRDSDVVQVSFVANGVAQAEQLGAVLQRRFKNETFRRIYESRVDSSGEGETATKDQTHTPTSPDSNEFEQGQDSKSWSISGDPMKLDLPLFSHMVEAYHGYIDDRPYAKAQLRLFADFFSVDLDTNIVWDYEEVYRVDYMRSHMEFVAKGPIAPDTGPTIYIRTAGPSEVQAIVKALRSIRPELTINVVSMTGWKDFELQDFENALATFGTDWTAVAEHVHTKTSNMVEKQYLHLVETGRKDLQEKAREADLRRATIGKQILEVPESSTPKPESSELAKQANAELQAYTEGDKMEPIVPKTDPIPSNDRWAEIRIKAAERTARHAENQSRRSHNRSQSQSHSENESEGIGEESIESRVARIKARVAELVGHVEKSSSSANQEDTEAAVPSLASEASVEAKQSSIEPTIDAPEASEAENVVKDERGLPRDYQFIVTSPDEEVYGKAVVLFDFARENDNELPLVKGQIVLISYRHDQGWLVAQDPKTGESGLVPEGYVCLLRELEDKNFKPLDFLGRWNPLGHSFDSSSGEVGAAIGQTHISSDSDDNIVKIPGYPLDPTVPNGFFGDIYDEFRAWDEHRPSDNVVEQQFANLIHEHGWHNLANASLEKMQAYSVNHKWALVCAIEWRRANPTRVAKTEPEELADREEERIAREVDEAQSVDDVDTPMYSKAVHFNDDLEQVRQFARDRPIAGSTESLPHTSDSEIEHPSGDNIHPVSPSVQGSTAGEQTRPQPFYSLAEDERPAIILAPPRLVSIKRRMHQSDTSNKLRSHNDALLNQPEALDQTHTPEPLPQPLPENEQQGLDPPLIGEKFPSDVEQTSASLDNEKSAILQQSAQPLTNDRGEPMAKPRKHLEEVSARQVTLHSENNDSEGSLDECAHVRLDKEILDKLQHVDQRLDENDRTNDSDGGRATVGWEPLLDPLSGASDAIRTHVPGGSDSDVGEHSSNAGSVEGHDSDLDADADKEESNGSIEDEPFPPSRQDKVVASGRVHQRCMSCHVYAVWTGSRPNHIWRCCTCNGENSYERDLKCTSCNNNAPLVAEAISVGDDRQGESSAQLSKFVDPPDSESGIDQLQTIKAKETSDNLLGAQEIDLPPLVQGPPGTGKSGMFNTL